MEVERGDFGSAITANENGDEATQEINLNTSSSQEEEAAIEKRKEQVRNEIKEVKAERDSVIFVSFASIVTGFVVKENIKEGFICNLLLESRW